MSANDNSLRFETYDRLTAISIDDALLFPDNKDKNDIIRLLKKVNVTVGSESKSIDDPKLINVEPDKYINPIEVDGNYEAGTVLGTDGNIKFLYNLIPIIITIRKYDDIYHLQIENKDFIITEEEFLFLLNSPLTKKYDYIEENPILDKRDKYMKKGDYFDLHLPAGLLLYINIDIEEMLKAKVSYKDYGYIFFSLPEILLPDVLSNINNVIYSGAIESYEKRWVNTVLVKDVFTRDVNTIHSHVVRKFVTDLQREARYRDDDITYSDIRMLRNYLEREWTDDIKFFVNKEFPGLLTLDFDTLVSWRSVVVLYRKDNIKINDELDDDTLYKDDKENILKRIKEMV